MAKDNFELALNEIKEVINKTRKEVKEQFEANLTEINNKEHYSPTTKRIIQQFIDLKKLSLNENELGDLSSTGDVRFGVAVAKMHNQKIKDLKEEINRILIKYFKQISV